MEPYDSTQKNKPMLALYNSTHMLDIMEGEKQRIFQNQSLMCADIIMQVKQTIFETIIANSVGKTYVKLALLSIGNQ